MDMSYEARLVSIGFPLSDAVTVCNSFRRLGTLDEYVREQEEIYRKKSSEYAKEVVG